MPDTAVKSAATKVAAPVTPPPAAAAPVRAPAKAVSAKAAKRAQPEPKPVAPAPIPARQPAPVAAIAAPEPAAPSRAALAAKDKIMTDTVTDMKQTTEAMTAKAETMFADASDRAKGAVAKGQQLVDEMNSFGKGNIEALVESSKIAARGLETLGQDAASYAKQSFEHASTTVKTMASIKSPTELLKLQSDYMRTSFDALVAQGSRSTEAMLKLAGEVAQPISNRFALAAEKVKSVG